MASKKHLISNTAAHFLKRRLGVPIISGPQVLSPSVVIRGEKNIYFPLDKERFVWYTYYSASRGAMLSMKDKGRSDEWREDRIFGL
jgi:hypothetical protein